MYPFIVHLSPIFLLFFYEADGVAAILGQKFYLKGSGNFPADAGQA